MEIALINRLKEPRIRRRVILGALSALIIWLTFFDSHSLIRRFGWYQEHRDLTEENEQLESQIETIETELDRGLSDERVEKIAREEYHMKKPDETVHRVEKVD